jgi:hypothetical protein
VVVGVVDGEAEGVLEEEHVCVTLGANEIDKVLLEVSDFDSV